jgi:hypothetical protein
MYGISVTMMDLPPRVVSSNSARARSVIEPRPAADQRAGREVRAGDPLQQLVHRAVGVLGDERHGVGELGDVVRRDVRGHADRDALRAVRQQIREARREHARLHAVAVEVRLEVDRLAVDVAQQLGCDRAQARFRVAVGRGRIAVDRAEVSLAVDEHVPERPRLGHARHGLVDGRVAVRVIVLDDFADDAGALRVGPIRLQALVVHRVEDAAVHRLQAVAHIG